VRVSSGLGSCTRADTEHMGLVDAILLIRERGIQSANREGMCTSGFVKVGFNRLVERPQSLVIQVVQEIPEQAQVKAGVFRKSKRLLEVINKLGFGGLALLHLQNGVRIHACELQTTFILREKFDGFGQGLTNFQNRKAPIRVDLFKQ